MYEDRTLYYRAHSSGTWRYVGTNLLTANNLRYVSFEEEIPQPRLHKAEVIGGQDVDFTDNVGPLQYTNGTHTLTLLLYQSTEAQRVSRLNAVISTLHGKMIDYRLSWIGAKATDDYFTGRVTVGVSHVTALADLITLTIDREPSMHAAS